MPFDPNKPFQPGPDSKPEFDPSRPFTPAQSQVTPDAADKAAHPAQQYTSPDEVGKSGAEAIKARLGDPERWKAILTGKGPAAQQSVGSDLGSAALAIPIESAPASLAKIGTYLGKSGFGPAVGRIAANTGIGYASGGAKGALIGGGLGLVGELASPVLGSSGDQVMQKAVGIKKRIPGLGTILADEGIVGTKAGMSDQVADRLEGLGDEISNKLETVDGLSEGIDSAKAAEPLQNYLKKLKVGDNVPGHSVTEAANVEDRAAEIANRGMVSGKTAWDYAKRAGAAGYRNQKALMSDSANMAQLEQQGYSGAVKQAYKAANPGDPSVDEAFSRMSDLYKAKQGLSTPETLRQGVPMTSLFGSAIGTAVAGAPGAAAGFLLSQAARTPLAKSLLGQALVKGGQVANSPIAIQSITKLLDSNESNK